MSPLLGHAIPQPVDVLPALPHPAFPPDFRVMDAVDGLVYCNVADVWTLEADQIVEGPIPGTVRLPPAPLKLTERCALCGRPFAPGDLIGYVVEENGPNGLRAQWAHVSKGWECAATEDAKDRLGGAG